MRDASTVAVASVVEALSHATFGQAANMRLQFLSRIIESVSALAACAVEIEAAKATPLNVTDALVNAAVLFETRFSALKTWSAVHDADLPSLAAQDWCSPGAGGPLPYFSAVCTPPHAPQVDVALICPIFPAKLSHVEHPGSSCSPTGTSPDEPTPYRG